MRIHWFDVGGKPVEDDIPFGTAMRGLLRAGQRPDLIMIDVNELADFLSDEMNVRNIRQYVRMLQLALRR